MSFFTGLTQSYSALSAKYGGFKAPVVKIAAGDSLITLAISALTAGTGLGLQSDSVSVTLNKDSASSASFTLVNNYSTELRTFIDKISVGSKLCIFMGYGSIYSLVFAGFVETLSYEFSDKPMIKVTAFDAVKLMMDCGKQERIWENGGFYMVDFTEIMMNYLDICPVDVLDMKPTLKTHCMLVQKTNDYDYIKNSLCKFCDRDFVVSGGFGHFFNPYSKESKVVTLGLGKGLTSFSFSPSYKKVSAIVSGDRLKNVRSKSSVATGLSYKNSMNKPQVITKENMPFETVADCKLYADRLVHDEICKAQTASGTCVGIPLLTPGKTIGINGIDKRWNDKSFILDSVTHTISASGYTTSFGIKGWY